MSLPQPPINPPVPPVAPSRNDDPEDFNLKANAMAAWYSPMITWFTSLVVWARDFATQLDAFQTDVTNSATSAASSAGIATTKRNEAVAARDIAVASSDTATQTKNDVITLKNDVTTARTDVYTARDLTYGYRQGAQQAQAAAEAARDIATVYATQQFKTTSSTNFTNTAGVKDVTFETGKPFLPNVTFLRGASRGTPSAQNGGYVTAYNAVTGAAKISLSEVYGPSTSFSDWDFSVGSPGGVTSAVQTIGAGIYTDANLAPLNSVTIITGANNSYATTNLPVIHANSASAGWSSSYDWVVETLGFGSGSDLRATQTAVPSVVGNLVGVGLQFMRKKVGTTWGRWKPVGIYPTSTLTVQGSDMYGSTLFGNNRVNHIATSLNGSVASFFFPATPEDGDRFYVYTNSRIDNNLVYKDKPVMGNGISLSTAGDNVKLNKPFSRFGFFYNLFNDAWMVE